MQCNPQNICAFQSPKTGKWLIITKDKPLKYIDDNYINRKKEYNIGSFAYTGEISMNLEDIISLIYQHWNYQKTASNDSEIISFIREKYGIQS